MGIIDDYLTEDKALASSKKVEAKGSIIDQYLDSPSDVPTRKDLVPAGAPTSKGVEYITPEESKAREYKGGPSSSRSVADIPVNAGTAALEALKSSAGEVGSGTIETFSGKPASGVGKVGMGLLSLANVVTDPISSVGADLTGNKSFGERAGALVGGILPVAPSAKAVNAALPKNRALKTLVESIGEENLPSVVAQMKANPRLNPVDLSPKVLQDTQHLFTTDGPQINYLANQVAKRVEGAKGAAEGAFDTLGKPVNALEKEKELVNNIREVGRTKIAPAVEHATPVNLSPVIKHIDDQLNPGVQSLVKSGLPSTEINKQLQTVRDILTNDKEMKFGAKELHDVQSVLRSEADGLLNSASGQDRRMGKALMDVRNKIVDAIDTASPQKDGKGTYKSALSDYRDEFHIKDAFQHGHDTIIKNNKTLQNRPEYFEEWVKNASKEELNAAKEGARVAIDTQINSMRTAATNPASNATNIGQVEFNKKRIETLFGKEEANKLFTKLEDERKIADANNKLVQGSQTAMRTASKEQFALPTASDVTTGLIPPAILEGASMLSGGPGGLATGVYAAVRGATKAKDMLQMKLQKEHNARYAKYAMPEGEARSELIQSLDAIANAPPKQSLLRRASNLARNVVPP